MKIGIVQQHNTADVADNMRRLAASVEQLAQDGAQLVVLQELHNSLYFCQTEDVANFDLAEPIPGPSTQFYGELAKRLGVVIVTSLFERRSAGLYHNTAVVIERDGTIAGKYRKMHIPDDPAYYEKFYFTPGDLGFRPIDTSVGRLGVLVCWDQWYPEAARLMALQGAEILIYPTAIGYEPSDVEEEQQRQRTAWTTVMRGHAVANGLPVVAVNRVGFEPSPVGKAEGQACSGGIQFWGSSFVAGPQGELLWQGSDSEEALRLFDIDLIEQNDQAAGEFRAVKRIHHAAAFIKAVPACAEQAGMPDGRIICEQSACIGQLAVFVPHIERIEQLFFHAVARPSLIPFAQLGKSVILEIILGNQFVIGAVHPFENQLIQRIGRGDHAFIADADICLHNAVCFVVIRCGAPC